MCSTAPPIAMDRPIGQASLARVRPTSRCWRPSWPRTSTTRKRPGNRSAHAKRNRKFCSRVRAERGWATPRPRSGERGYICLPSQRGSTQIRLVRFTLPEVHEMKALIALALLASVAAVGRSDDSLVWPRFRGPNGSGVAEGQKPPVEFGPDKNLKWKVAVPAGVSSPIVAGENLVVTAFDDGRLYTIAYRRA